MLNLNINNFLNYGLPTLGLAIGIIYVLSFLNLLFRNLVSPYIFSKRKFIRKFGNWVIITGATDGIGKAYAELLAKEKYNLVLISRNIDKLEKVKQEILSEVKIEIKLVAVDFTKLDIYDKIENEIKGLDVGLLINNVGMSLDFPDYLTSEFNSKEKIVNILNCNCLSTMLMTRIILNLRMMENGGFILNMSSASSKYPTPFLAEYGATKAFINSFSDSMRMELKNSKVIFQNVVPFFVATKMSKQRPSLTCPSAKDYANSVLSRLGTCSLTYGCFVHELQAWLIGMMPAFILDYLTYKVLSSTRKRALRKLVKVR